MRICLIGGYSGNPDEGMKKVTWELYKRLNTRHQVLLVEPRKMFNRSFWRQILLFSPDVLHYIPGPTIRSFVFLRLAKLLSGCNSKAIASATKPYFSIFSRHLIPLLKPDLILTQSLKFEEFFSNYGCKVSFLPNGVDTEDFRPFSERDKRHFRQKYKIPIDQFVVLHVGHIKRNRDLEVLAEVQRLDGIQVLVVGGTSMPMDVHIKDLLEESGCMVWCRYFENIAEIYGMSDCFVFPTYDLEDGILPRRYNQIGCVDLPLSVLEAMACNLPVLCTKFGALPRLFEPGDGFLYFQGEQDLFRKIALIESGLTVNTWQKVKRFDWTQVAINIEHQYLN